MTPNYNITSSYSYGGKRLPITSLKFGQWGKAGSVNIWGGTSINNYYNMMPYPELTPPEPPKESWMMKATPWFMLGGGVLSAIGDIWSAFKTNKAEGQGEVLLKEKQDVGILKSAYKKQCTILGPKSDGSYIIVDTKTGKRTSAADYTELEAALTKYDANTEEPDKTTKAKVTTTTSTVDTPKTTLKAKATSTELGASAEEDPTNDILDLYTSNGISGTSPVAAKDFDLKTLTSANFKGVFDDSPTIGNFESATVTKVSEDGKTITIGGRQYQIVDQKDGCVYLQDMTAGDSNKQIYILESDGKNPPTYSLHQREFLGDKTTGYGIAAKKSTSTTGTRNTRSSGSDDTTAKKGDGTDETKKTEGAERKVVKSKDKPCWYRIGASKQDERDFYAFQNARDLAGEIMRRKAADYRNSVAIQIKGADCLVKYIIEHNRTFFDSDGNYIGGDWNRKSVQIPNAAMVNKILKDENII